MAIPRTVSSPSNAGAGADRSSHHQQRRNMMSSSSSSHHQYQYQHQTTRHSSHHSTNTYYSTFSSTSSADDLSDHSESSFEGGGTTTSSNNKNNNNTARQGTFPPFFKNKQLQQQQLQQQQQSYMHSYKKRPLPPHTQYVALDCEMVGDVTGQSHLARVVIVNWRGKCLLDRFCKPDAFITDYRTAISGITETDLLEAPPLEQVRQDVLAIIRDKIVVGHGLQNDFDCMHLPLPPLYKIRDTATYQPFLQKSQVDPNLFLPRKLKDLVKEKLATATPPDACICPTNTTSSSNKSDLETDSLHNSPYQGFQETSHCPFQDAKAALHLYKQHRPRWEACLTRILQTQSKQQNQQQQSFLNVTNHHQQSLFFNNNNMLSCGLSSATTPTAAGTTPPTMVMMFDPSMMQQQMQNRSSHHHHHNNNNKYNQTQSGSFYAAAQSTAAASSVVF